VVGASPARRSPSISIPGGAAGEEPSAPVEAISSEPGRPEAGESEEAGGMLSSTAVATGRVAPVGQTSNETTPTRKTKPTTADASTAPLAPIPAR
jgi:hypothetical protein